VKDKHYVRICPVCNSTDVSHDFSVAAAVASGALYNYRCNRCGFVGIIFPEMPADELPQPRNLDEIERDYSTLDISYGRGYSSLLKYLAPFGAALNLALYLETSSLIYILGVIVFLYLSLYLFARKYFGKYRILKFIGFIFVVLYALIYKIL